MNEFDRLVSLLEEESRLADRMVMRLRTLDLHLATGEARFLGRLSDEIDELAITLGELEIARTFAAAELADRVGIAPDHASLGQLISTLGDQEAGRLGIVGARLRDAVGEADALRQGLLSAAPAATGTLTERIRRLELVGMGYASPSAR